MRIGLLGTIYLVIGAIVASTRRYYIHFDTAKLIGSAVLAIVLWPLSLAGINLAIH